MKRNLLMTICYLLLSAQIAFAQSAVHGRVLDEKGEGLSGANVKVKGTSLDTYTDNDGNFTINTKSDSKLVITYSGLKTFEVKADDGVTVKMAVDKRSIEGVVVTALGIKRQAKELGYSTTTIGGNEINQAKVINPLTGLTGKVSGLQIQTANNGVNPSVRVTLRGNRSILGNNQALIVVDGVLVDNDYLSKINPNDIESTNILKGAAASALYGSDASNGVIIITTRKGGSGKGKTRITYSSTIQAERVSYMPKLQEQFGSYGGENFNQILGIQFANDPFKKYYPYENQSFGPAYNGQSVPLGGPVQIFNANGTVDTTTKMVPYSAVHNGRKNFFNTGLTFQNNISVGSGDENSNLFASFSNTKVNGIVPKDQATRNTLRVNAGRKFGILKIDFNSTYTKENINEVGGSYFQDRPLYWTIINTPAHVDLNSIKNWQTDPYASPDGYYNAYYGNPWWSIDQSRQLKANNFILGNVKAGLDITNWLNLSYTLGYSRQEYNSTNQKNGYTFAPWAIADPWQAGTIPSSQKYLAPSMFQSFNNYNRLSGDFLAAAHKTFGDFSTKLLLGSTAWKRTNDYASQQSDNLVVPGLFNINYRQGEAIVNQYNSANSLVGMFIDGTVGYKDYLFLHASGRNDWNSLLPVANRSFFYPSVDAAFVFTDAIKSLKEKSSVLNYGKVRLGFAKVGQVNVSPYSLVNTVTNGTGFPYGTQAGFTLANQYNNPNLKPEFTTEVEGGLDLGFLNNRIMFGLSIYSAKTTNQTLYSDISWASGYASSLVNAGTMYNKGIELDLRLTPLLNLGPVKWNFTANYAYNKNTVGSDISELSISATGNNNTQTSNSVFATPGQAYPYLKTTDWVRDGQGRIIVDANTGLPSKSASTVGMGTTIPPTKIGFTNIFVYKGFTLNCVIDGRFGAVIYNNMGTDLDFTGVSWYSAQTGRMPFVIPNSSVSDGKGGYVANTNVVTNDGNWAFWANTWDKVGSNYVNSADYWKLREVSLSYALPVKMVSKLKYIQGISLGVSGRNLIMWRPKDNVWTDPEFSDFGVGNAIGTTSINLTPPTRIYGVSLNVNF